MQRIKIQINSIAILIMMAIFAHAQSSESSLEVTHIQNAKTVPLYEIFEITFQHDREYENPFFDVAIQMVLHSPSGKNIEIGGFHYGSSKPPKIHTSEDERGRRHNRYEFEKQDIWKARFAPQELGEWSYQYEGHIGITIPLQLK